jgi:hypothetical protein
MSFVVGCRVPNNSVSAGRPISTQFVFLGGPGQSLESAFSVWACRGKSPIMGRFPNMGMCFISYQEVLRSVLRNVNH